MQIKLDKNYEVKATLGTIRDIEKSFGKSFYEVAKSLGGMKVEEQIRLLFLGARKTNPDLNETAFFELCEEYLGIGNLLEYIEKFFYALQYPGLSEDEIKEKIEKKLQRNQTLQQAKDLIG